MPSAPRLALVLFVALGACKSSPAREPDVPLPADILALPLFDPAALGPARPPWGAAPVPLAVLEFTPQGRHTHVRSLDLRFNQPVVAQDLGGPDPTALLAIDPPLPGRARWLAPDHLSFQPDDDALASATRYSVRLVGDLRSQDGQPLVDDRTWTFETAPPAVRGVTPGYDGEHRVDAPIILDFDEPIATAALVTHLSARAHATAPQTTNPRPYWSVDHLPRTRPTAGTPLPIEIRPATKRDLLAAGITTDPGPGQFAILPATRWPAAREIELTLRPGLRGLAGPLPIDRAWATTFTTPRPQALESSTCTRAAPCSPADDITLRFRNPIAADQLARFTVTPKPDYLYPHNYRDERHVELSGGFRPDTVYTVRTPPGLKDIYGQPLAPLVYKAVFIQAADLGLSAPAGILPPARPHVGLESHHVRSVRVRLGVFTDHELTAVPDLDPTSTTRLADLPFPARARELTLDLDLHDKARWASHKLDLDALTADLRPPGPLRSPVLVELTPLALAAGSDRLTLPPAVRGLYRVTDLALVAHASRSATVVRAVHLSSGTPAPGVAVCHLGPDPKDSTCDPLGTTDQDGLLRATIPLPRRSTRTDDDAPPPERVRLIGEDPTTHALAHLDLPGAPDDLPYTRRPADNPKLRRGERLLARLVRERGAYRPGERVHLVGWTALDTPHTPHTLARLPANTTVELTLTDPSAQIVARTTARTSPAGKFSAALSVPATAALGRYQATATLLGEAVHTSLKVEDYRIPEFTVSASARTSDLLVGEPAVVDIDAAYLFGAAVALTDVGYQSACRPFHYTPPNLEPGWRVGDTSAAPGHTTHGAVAPTAADPPGRRTLRTKLPVAAPKLPHRCALSFYAQDASAQGVGAESTVTLHPAPIYLAIRPPDVAHRGDRITLPLRALTRDGERTAAAQVRLHITRRWDEPVYKEDASQRWISGTTQRAADPVVCTVDLTAAGPDATCPLLLGTRDTDSYELTATATLDGHTAETTTTFHVHDRQPQPPAPLLLAPPQGLELRTSTTRVRPGDQVVVTIRAPWQGARGELLTARRGVHTVHPFTIKNQRATVTLTADDTWTPALHLTAHVIADDPPGTPYKKRHTATAELRQDPDHRRLAVTVAAPRQAGPGDSLKISVTVHDDHARPVAGRVAVWAVDEAVLSLTDEQLPDLLPHFIPGHDREVADHDDLRAILLPFVATHRDPALNPRRGRLAGRVSSHPHIANGGAVSGPALPGSPRSRFETTPLFLGDALVDDSGAATVTATLPDNLTTFRITALASADLAAAPAPGRFGGAETRVVVTAPLVVRAAAPRQLRPGDTAEIAALIDNRTSRPGRVRVTADLLSPKPAQTSPTHLSQKPDSTSTHLPQKPAETSSAASNHLSQKPATTATHPSKKPATTEDPALELLSPHTATTTIPANGQARVIFKIRARSAVDAALDLRADFTPTGAPAVHDALRVPLPVVPESTRLDRVAIHGALTTDRAVQIPIQLPPDADPRRGGLELHAATSLVAGLDDAARALVDYPYGCAEQTASRLLPLLALTDLHQPLPPDFTATIFTRLASMQTASGGFAYWPGAAVHPYASAYVTWLLQRAASAGLELPQNMLPRALDDLQRRITAADLAALPLALQTDLGVPLALALHALADAGRDIDAPAAALFARRTALPLFARATLLLALHRRAANDPAVRTLTAELLANLSEGPDGAHAVEQLPHNMDAYFHSDTRTDAIVLLALLHTAPDHPVLPKLARALQQRGPAGAWRNTQENAYAILALAEWSRRYEPTPPDLQTRVWLASRTVLDVPLHDKTAATTLHTPMLDLLNLSQQTAHKLPLVLHRQGTGPLYWRLALDWTPATAAPPARDQGLGLTRTLRTARPQAAGVDLGDSVALDLDLTNHKRVRYVALDVPIPAGLEPLQLDLGHGQSATTLAGHTGRWVSRQELRRDRIQIFADDLPPGQHHHTIHLRATTRGRYTFPPAHAEAMYIPEINGRTTATTLEVR